MLAVIGIPETPREHIDSGLGDNKNTGWCMIAVANVSCNNVINQDMI